MRENGQGVHTTERIAHFLSPAERIPRFSSPRSRQPVSLPGGADSPGIITGLYLYAYKKKQINRPRAVLFAVSLSEAYR